MQKFNTSFEVDFWYVYVSRPFFFFVAVTVHTVWTFIHRYETSFEVVDISISKIYQLNLVDPKDVKCLL